MALEVKLLKNPVWFRLVRVRGYVDSEDEVKFYCFGFQTPFPTEDLYPTKCAENHPSFKKRTVKIVSGWSCDLSARVGILPNEMAGLYQTIDGIGDGSA
jgi:hypothetical protein